MANVLQMVKNKMTGVEDVGDLVGELDAVRAKGIAAHQELERLEAIRLAAETFEAAEAANARIARVTWETDRLAAMIPELEQRLAFARAVKQKDAIARHVAANRKLWPRFRAALKAAVDMQTEAIKQREVAIAEIGEHAVTLHLPVIAFRGFLYSDLFDIYAAELDRVFAAPAPQPAVAAVVAPKVQPVPPVKPAAPKPAEQAVAPAPKPKRPLRKDTVAVGGRLVSVLRSGIDIDGFQAMVGDQIALPAEQAEQLVRAGSCDYANAV